MKKESEMSYDSLMNHFVNYPNHPEWLHKLFSPLVVMLTSTLLFIFLSYVVFSVKLGAALIFALIMLFIFSRAISAMQNMSGHGVGLNPKRTSKVRKTLMRSMLFLSILSSVALIAGCYGYTKDGNILLVLLPGALVWGLVGSILIWKYHMYYITWYGNEYDARTVFKNKGATEQEVDTAIRVLRKNGILPTSSEIK